MLSRDEYEKRKAKRIEELQFDAHCIEKQLEQIYQALFFFEEETYEDFKGDVAFDSWKAKRDEV